MKTELFNLILDYQKNRNTPEKEECFDKLVDFLKTAPCFLECNLEIDATLKNTIKDFHKVSNVFDVSKKELCEFKKTTRIILPQVMADSQQIVLEKTLSDNTEKMNSFLAQHGVMLIRELLQKLEVDTATKHKQ